MPLKQGASRPLIGLGSDFGAIAIRDASVRIGNFYMMESQRVTRPEEVLMIKHSRAENANDTAEQKPELLALFSELLLNLYRAGRASQGELFQEQAFGLIKTLIPFDAGWWASGVDDISPGGDYEPQIFEIYLHNLSEKMLQHYNKRKQFDTVALEAAQASGVTLNICLREWYPESHWQYFGANQFRHVLCTTVLDPITGLNTAIVLYRRSQDQRFSEQERQLKQALMRHLIDANARSRIAPWVRDAAKELNYPLAAIADAAGSLRHTAEGFAEMLQTEWSGWRGPKLPEALCEQMQAGNGGQYSGTHVIANISRGEQQHMALVQLRSVRLADQLSKQQMKIAKYSADGLSFKEIARLSDLAPKTVRNYLTLIYHKLGVKNKIQLAEILREGE